MKQVTELLINQNVEQFRFVEGGTLILHLKFGRSTQCPGAKLWVESAWRLVNDKKVLVGSLDENSFVISELRNLIDQSIDRVTINELTGDIELFFSSGLVIQTFGRCRDCENWEIRCQDGARIGIGENYESFANYISSE